MTGQLNLLGHEAHVYTRPADPPKLTERQQLALDLVERFGGLPADELGARLHHEKHAPTSQCDWCYADGLQLLSALRRKGLVVRRKTGVWEPVRRRPDTQRPVEGESRRNGEDPDSLGQPGRAGGHGVTDARHSERPLDAGDKERVAPAPQAETDLSSVLPLSPASSGPGVADQGVTSTGQSSPELPSDATPDGAGRDGAPPGSDVSASREALVRPTRSTMWDGGGSIPF